MRFQPSRLALMAAAIVTLSTTAAAVAQDSPPPGPPMAEEGHGGHGGSPMMGHHGFDPEAHAQHLRDVLQLRPEQEGALKAYLASMASPKHPDGEQHGDGKHDDEDSQAPLTTPQRLDREAEQLARATEAFKARAAATKTFYAALSPSQRKAFDALGPMMGGHHGPMMRGVQFRHFKAGPRGMPGMSRTD
uniref:LTXXQ motif family protein n=1 Tax=Caulobacter sp. (strain K31) TaxID=366602 RepID=B0T6A2_CAUSK